MNTFSGDSYRYRYSVPNDHVYRMVKERYRNILPNQTIVSNQSELTILLCQPINSLLLMKTTLPWYSSLQLLPSYIYDHWSEDSEPKTQPLGLELMMYYQPYPHNTTITTKGKPQNYSKY